MTETTTRLDVTEINGPEAPEDDVHEMDVRRARQRRRRAFIARVDAHQIELEIDRMRHGGDA